MMKQRIETVKERNGIIANIIDAMINRDSFLLVGHQNPDEDCIASLVAFALLLKKFHNEASIMLSNKIHEHYQYLLDICRYNSIPILDAKDKFESRYRTLVICDTPKPSMVAKSPGIKELLADSQVLHIEVDHHLEADSAYIGDPGYCLVDEASSASELVGQIGLKLRRMKKLLATYQIGDLFSRNMVLAILTGIVGDSKMGKFLKTRRERKYYLLFSKMFNRILTAKTIKDSNFSNMDEVFGEIQRLSSEEGRCFDYLMGKKRLSQSIGYCVLSENDTAELLADCSRDTLISVASSMADTLAEESDVFSLVSYYDPPDESDLVQFRMRRGKNYTAYDLRHVLELFSIENGGGHEGAIGFRVPKAQITDYGAFILRLINGVENAIADKPASLNS